MAETTTLAALGGSEPRVVYAEREPLTLLASAPDGTMATAGAAGLVLWRAGEEPRILPQPARVEEIVPWAGRWLLRSGDTWAVHGADGLFVEELTGADKAVLAAGDDPRQAVLSPDGLVTVRAPDSAEPVADLLVQPQALDLTWVGPGRLATYDGQTIEIRDLSGGAPLTILADPPAGLSWWGTVAGSSWLLTVTHDGSLTWWDLGLLDAPPGLLAARIRQETGFQVAGGRLALARP